MNYSIDGNQVMCVGRHFVNIQESHAGFGDSLREAFINYWDTKKEVPLRSSLEVWELPWCDELK